VKPRFEVYKAVFQQMRDIFAEHTPIIEPLSLDAAYLDVTENLQGIQLIPYLMMNTELRDINSACDLRKSLGEPPHHVQSNVMACCRLWHPYAEDRLQRMGRLVHPIIIDFDLRESRQNKGSSG
jgi:nucleotidyltransferase/DNA polymerase involved in DNA repair